MSVEPSPIEVGRRFRVPFWIKAVILVVVLSGGAGLITFIATRELESGWRTPVIGVTGFFVILTSVLVSLYGWIVRRQHGQNQGRADGSDGVDFNVVAGSMSHQRYSGK